MNLLFTTDITLLVTTDSNQNREFAPCNKPNTAHALITANEACTRRMSSTKTRKEGKENMKSRIKCLDGMDRE